MEHVLHFDYQGQLHGALPCLGRGPRSFLPVYLPSREEAEGAGAHGSEEGTEESDPVVRAEEDKEAAMFKAGWRVYMRDGRGGIICTQPNQ